MLKISDEVNCPGLLWDCIVQGGGFTMRLQCSRWGRRWMWQALHSAEYATLFQTPPEDKKPEFPLSTEISQCVCLHWAPCGGENVVHSDHSRRWGKYF